MEKNYELKKCSVNDLEKLRDISIETFTDTFKDDNSEKDLKDYIERSYNANKLRTELLNKNSEFYFLHYLNEVAGYIKINFLDAQSEKMDLDSCEVERIYIRNKYKRNGFGKVLINKAIEIAKDKGMKKIWLGVWEKNFNAIAFYEKMGFRKIGSHSFFMGDDEQIDYILEKEF